jgi:hypothetical protein
MATALMCRASTETAVYLLATREIKWRDDLKMVQEIKLDHSLIEKRWGEVLRKAKLSGYIDEKLEQQVREVREAGNFAAHYGQRFDKEMQETINKPTVKGVKGWINKADSLRTLRKTAEILEAVMGKALLKCMRSGGVLDNDRSLEDMGLGINDRNVGGGLVEPGSDNKPR